MQRAFLWEAVSTRLNRLYSADTEKKTTILQHGLNFNPCSNNQKPLRGISEMKASKSRTDGAQLSSAGPPRNPPFTFVRSRRLTFTLLFDGKRGEAGGSFCLVFFVNPFYTNGR